jgi:hypothetical protein
MKKSLMSLTLILAMVAGVSLAFANHAPGKLESKRFGKLIDNMGNITWVDVTGLTPGVDYECQNAQETCITQFVGDNPANAEIVASRLPGHFAQ